MKELYNDSLENELKYKFDIDQCPQLIFDIMNKYFSLFEEGIDYITDYYYDTDDSFFFKNHLSYRLRIRDDSKRLRINFKTPSIRQQQSMFVRREMISKIKVQNNSMESPLGISCIVNSHVNCILKNAGYDVTDKACLHHVLTIKTMRVRYWVAMKEQCILMPDILQNATKFSLNHKNTYEQNCKIMKKNDVRACSGYFGQGLVGFDYSMFYKPKKPMSIENSQEFEFELWNGALCPELFELSYLVAEDLEKLGCSPCVSSKYEDFLSRLNSQERNVE